MEETRTFVTDRRRILACREILRRENDDGTYILVEHWWSRKCPDIGGATFEVRDADDRLEECVALTENELRQTLKAIEEWKGRTNVRPW